MTSFVSCEHEVWDRSSQSQNFYEFYFFSYNSHFLIESIFNQTSQPTIIYKYSYLLQNSALSTDFFSLVIIFQRLFRQKKMQKNLKTFSKRISI